VKHVVSVSLGSSKRDSTAQAVFLGEEFILERVGTDGDMQKAVQKIGELDGRVDAIGLGVLIFTCGWVRSATLSGMQRS